MEAALTPPMMDKKTEKMVCEKTMGRMTHLAATGFMLAMEDLTDLHAAGALSRCQRVYDILVKLQSRVRADLCQKGYVVLDVGFLADYAAVAEEWRNVILTWAADADGQPPVL